MIVFVTVGRSDQQQQHGEQSDGVEGRLSFVHRRIS